MKRRRLAEVEDGDRPGPELAAEGQPVVAAVVESADVGDVGRRAREIVQRGVLDHVEDGGVELLREDGVQQLISVLLDVIDDDPAVLPRGLPGQQTQERARHGGQNGERDEEPEHQKRVVLRERQHAVPELPDDPTGTQRGEKRPAAVASMSRRH